MVEADETKQKAQAKAAGATRAKRPGSPAHGRQADGNSAGRQLGAPGIIALVAILSAAPPIATDLCLPAIPDLPAFFNTGEAEVNFILVAFFFFMAVGTLVMGPLADKYGRKPVLFASLGLFMVTALACAFCSSIEVVIALRVVQGIGGGGMVALGTALVKDCFSGDMRQKVLVVTMAISVVAPMAAPVLGAAILTFTSWQGTFVAQTLAGLCAVPLALALKEPLPESERLSDGVVATLGRLVVVGRNKRFLLPLLVCAVCTAPYMTYISSASYIYTGFFQLDKVTYSLFFAANAALSALGSYLVIVVQDKVFPRRSLSFAMAASVVSGVLVIAVGPVSPFVFLATFALFTLAGGFIRPLITNILLLQQQGDTGSASSLINTVYTVYGAVGMMAATLPWSTYIFGLGLCVAVAAAFSLVGFLLLGKSKLKIKGL